ncbi:hypothetical protein Poli38472_012805 [Pythium oligandrum]|uniref:Uncharacterized protein n=1 Tax=Pythium oligandrum TaxID=41045 RepID=A0A8K1FN12_PYTOL|nr:hypothetical protein Poli38472_012805 [Pythium oligandrum]|eukprot:TMW64183.1 hypothetical protein Poli38472_012805 [Pythium oligandrum]
MSSKPGNARNTPLRKETAKATSTPSRDVARDTDADDARSLESDKGRSSGDRDNGDGDKSANDGDNNGDDDSDGGSGGDDGDDKNTGGEGSAGRGANARGAALGGTTSPSTAASVSGDAEDDHHRSSLPSLAEIENKIARGESVSHGEFRQMVDQETSELIDIFEQRADVGGSLSAPLERWETPLGVTLAPVIAREDSEGVVKPWDEILLVRRPPTAPGVFPDPGNSADPLTSVLEALQLARELRRAYGPDRLLPRIATTARVCSWLTHLSALYENLVTAISLRKLDKTGKETSKAVSVMALSAQVRSSEAEKALEVVQMDLRTSQDRNQDLQAKLTRVSTQLADFITSCPTRPLGGDLLHQRLSAVHRADSDSSQSALRVRVRELETRVEELEEEAVRVRKRLSAYEDGGLGVKQLQRIYNFCWSQGFGTGIPELWGQLLQVCADDAPGDITTGTTLQVFSIPRSAGSAPPALHHIPACLSA